MLGASLNLKSFVTFSVSNCTEQKHIHMWSTLCSDIMCFLVIISIYTFFSILSCTQKTLTLSCQRYAWVYCVSLFLKPKHFLALVAQKNTTLCCSPCPWMFCVSLIWVSCSTSYCNCTDKTSSLCFAVRDSLTTLNLQYLFREMSST